MARCSAGPVIAVSAFSAHQDAALDLAYWLASAPVQDGAYFWGGGQPGNVAAWDDPRADEGVPGLLQRHAANARDRVRPAAASSLCRGTGGALAAR